MLSNACLSMQNPKRGGGSVTGQLLVNFTFTRTSQTIPLTSTYRVTRSIKRRLLFWRWQTAPIKHRGSLPPREEKGAKLPAIKSRHAAERQSWQRSAVITLSKTGVEIPHHSSTGRTHTKTATKHCQYRADGYHLSSKLLCAARLSTAALRWLITPATGLG